jgi:hypothetical protein
VHDLVAPERVRDPVPHALLAAVDEDLAAAPEQEPRLVVINPLLRDADSAPELGRDLVRGRVRPDLDEQLGRAVEAAQAYPVGAQWNACESTDLFCGLAGWPVPTRRHRHYLVWAGLSTRKV